MRKKVKAVVRQVSELKVDQKEEQITPKVNKLIKTRDELMWECAALGVKNYRVLNKQELAYCLANIEDKVKVSEIVAGAVARWKLGFGKRSES